MKRVAAIITLLILSFNTHSQDTTNAVIKKRFLTDQSFKLTPTEVISTFRQAEESWLRWYDDPAPFESAFLLNAFDYFELNDIYDSELKKEVFKQTSEYKTLLDSLKKIKSDYLTSTYYQFGFNHVGGGNFKESGENGGVDYDLQMKGFEIGIGEVLPYQCSNAFCPRVIEDVEFKQLPIRKKYNLRSNSDNSYTQYLFIPMATIDALEVENNRNVIEILRVFNLQGIDIATFSDSDFIKDNNGKQCKVVVVKGKSMRLIIYNKSTNKIYFDKLYPKIPIK